MIMRTVLRLVSSAVYLPRRETEVSAAAGKRTGGFWRWVRQCSRRAALRRALLSLDDRVLRDIGIDRTRARREATRAPWQK
jgi:uncharacterized protein YjiS (DUF1127 family)